MGAGGTLGIVTAAVLKLFPRPRAIHTAWCAVPDAACALALLARARAVVDLVLAHIPGTADPLGKQYAHYVLLELAWSASDTQALSPAFCSGPREPGDAPTSPSTTSGRPAPPAECA